MFSINLFLNFRYAILSMNFLFLSFKLSTQFLVIYKRHNNFLSKSNINLKLNITKE